MKKKILLSKKVLPEGLKLLKESYNLLIAEELDLSLKELLNRNKDAFGLISFLSDEIDHDLIDISSGLKIISNYAVGYNNIDVKYATQRNIYVTNTPDVLTDATADLTWALILSASRKIIESDNFVRNNCFKGWGATLFLGKELKGSTLGIIGLGRIGTAVALRAKCFGMNVVYFSKTQKSNLETKYGFKYLPFRHLIQEADIVSVHISLNQDTRHLFHKEIFELMKSDAIFINVSRGQVVNESDLTHILKNKKQFFAGLDVYEYEPLVQEELKSLPNVVLTPHTGSATHLTRLNMVKLNIADINRVIEGSKPINLVK
jgi:glyoxylate reductase